ncbi:MAG: lysophospholipid acyltransferase family protein [Coriobacteriales bacterium]
MASESMSRKDGALSKPRHGFVTPVERFLDAPLRGEGHESRWFSYVVYALGTVVLKVAFRYSVEGMEHLDEIPEGKAAVIAANHACVLDPVLLVLALRFNVRFMAKEELFDSAFLAQALARVGAFPVKRGTADRRAVRRAVAAVRRGEYLGIFPEGTRIRCPDQERHNHAGAVMIARAADAPIVPVGIEGTDRIRPLGSRLLHFPHVHVRFGSPVWPSEYDDVPKHDRSQVMIDDVMRMVYELRDTGSCTPRRAPGATSR